MPNKSSGVGHDFCRVCSHSLGLMLPPLYHSSCAHPCATRAASSPVPCERRELCSKPLLVALMQLNPCIFKFTRTTINDQRVPIDQQMVLPSQNTPAFMSQNSKQSAQEFSIVWLIFQGTNTRTSRIRFLSCHIIYISLDLYLKYLCEFSLVSLS